jgi:hypothetical protein
MTNQSLTLLVLEGTATPVTINEDGLDCLSNDAVDKQYPIHIAYRSSHVMTIIEGDDGVARLITRDLIGLSFCLFLGSHSDQVLMFGQLFRLMCFLFAHLRKLSISTAPLFTLLLF